MLRIRYACGHSIVVTTSTPSLTVPLRCYSVISVASVDTTRADAERRAVSMNKLCGAAASYTSPERIIFWKLYALERSAPASGVIE